METLDVADIPLQPRQAGCLVPLIALQTRGWNRFVEQGRRGESRMCAASVRVSGLLNTSLLRRSIEAVVQRHESLRTRIVAVDGIPRQHIDTGGGCELEVIDLAKVSPTNVEREARRLAQEFIDENIDLSGGPLFAVKLLKLSKLDHVLILALDHIVSDGVSYGILTRDIWASCKQATQGRPFSLAPLPIQFGDYAVWQQRTYDTWLKKHETYWRARLAGAPRPQLPLDDGLAEVDHPTVAVRHFAFGKMLSTGLRDMARSEQTLLPLVVLAVYVAVLSRWCNQRDLVLTFVSHGRHGRPELENMIGFLVNLLLFRIEVTKDDSFLDLLKRVSQEFHSACQHQDFNRVPDFVPECPVPFELSFDWAPANWTGRSIQQEEAVSQFTVQPFPIQTFRYRVNESYKLAAVPSETASGIVITVMYRVDLFAPSTIERFGRNLRVFAEQFTQRPLASVESVVFAP